MGRAYLSIVGLTSIALFSAILALPAGYRLYPDCNIARWAGAAPIAKGAPGYRLALDGNRNGIACEAGETWPHSPHSHRYGRWRFRRH